MHEEKNVGQMDLERKRERERERDTERARKKEGRKEIHLV
jgi:hypothetical protein